MKVYEFFRDHPADLACTIKDGRKEYLCRADEAVLYFGAREIKEATPRPGYENHHTIRLHR